MKLLLVARLAQAGLPTAVGKCSHLSQLCLGLVGLVSVVLAGALQCCAPRPPTLLSSRGFRSVSCLLSPVVRIGLKGVLGRNYFEAMSQCLHGCGGRIARMYVYVACRAGVNNVVQADWA